jgi:3-deoxy-D-manno-octulosonic-acid transferase
MFMLIYRILFIPLFLLMLPHYGMRMWRRGGYAKDFKYRLGFWPVMEKFDKKRIWIQSVSVGEVKAACSLIDRFTADGRFEVILTTTSSTGYALAKELYASKILFVGLFPWDFYPFSALAWKRICPDIALLMEGELWPEHLHQAHIRRVPVYLINARLSDRTFARYLRFKSVSRAIFSRVTKILTSSNETFDRFVKLGVDGSKLSASGNIKFDCDYPRIDTSAKVALKFELGFSGESLILLGSATWHGEEEWLVRCFGEIRKKTERDWRLLLVPRHAERRAEIAAMLRSSGLRWHQRSRGHPSAQVDVCLADTTGELVKLTGISDLIFIGKSLFESKGGQSPLDAAAYGVPMVYGNNMANFRDICHSLELAGGAVKATDGAAAQEAIVELAMDARRRASLSEILCRWRAQNRGAAECAYRLIVGDCCGAK